MDDEFKYTKITLDIYRRVNSRIVVIIHNKRQDSTADDVTNGQTIRDSERCGYGPQVLLIIHKGWILLEEQLL